MALPKINVPKYKLKLPSDGRAVKYRPLTYLREGSFTLPNFSSSDQLHTVSFTSVGTSSYTVIGSLRGFNSSSSYSNQNDLIFTIFSKTATSFKLAIREVSSASGTVRFEYFLVDGV